MAETRTDLTDVERDLMKHSLGWPKCYRNYFAAEPKSPNGDICAALAERGLMRSGKWIPGGLVIYHVTDEGKAVLHG